jgi:hypothetical protein
MTMTRVFIVRHRDEREYQGKRSSDMATTISSHCSRAITMNSIHSVVV